MFYNVLYDLILFVTALFSAPRIIYQMIYHKKYRKSLLQRFGRNFPKIEKKGKKLIWVHGVSMGEVKAVASLAKELKKQEDAILVFSTATETGYVESQKSTPEADHHVFLPFDFNTIVAPIVKKVKPDLVVLCETDFWYNFLRVCKKEGAKVALVNGKLSEKSLARFLFFRAFSKKLFSFIDLFCVQSSHYEERFKELHIPEKKIVVTGNIKFDGHFPEMIPEEVETWKEKLGILGDDLVFVAGSTHDPEEKLLIETLKSLWQEFPHLKTLLVPRHPERFDEVAHLLQKNGIAFERYSSLIKRSEPTQKLAKIVLMDAMGLLRQCYQLADLAFVAGSFTPRVGGHNIIEPSWYGVPVLFGPYMHTQPELLELVQQYQAGIQVGPEQLVEVMRALFQNPEERQILGKRGVQLVTDLKGATKKTLKEVSQLIS